MLKVVSILMIVFGIIAAVFGVIGVVGSGMFVSAAAGTGFAALGTYFLIQGIIAVIGSIVEVIGGFKGLRAVKEPEKAPSCVKYGIICAVLAIVSIVIGIAVAGMPEFSTLILSVVGSLLIPGLYIYALKGVSATPSSN